MERASSTPDSVGCNEAGLSLKPPGGAKSAEPAAAAALAVDKLVSMMTGGHQLLRNDDA
jgi:hypothetical protein